MDWNTFLLISLGTTLAVLLPCWIGGVFESMKTADHVEAEIEAEALGIERFPTT